MHELSVQHRVLSPDECNRLIDLANNSLQYADVNSHVGISIPCTPGDPVSVGAETVDLMRYLLAPYNLETLRLSRMSAGHYHGLHADQCPATPNRRVYVGLYLGWYFDGGELEMPELGIIIDPQPGMAIKLDANTLHRVRPVVSGKRFVLTGWGV